MITLLEEKFQKYYPKCPLDTIKYEIEKFGSIEKVTIKFGEQLMCPIYCICDSHYMHWYGDHGSFSFDCTWNTSIFNIPFNSPNYLFEKFDVTSIAGGAGKAFNSEECEEKVLQYIYESDWYQELDGYDKSRIKGYLTSEKWHPDIDDYHLSSNVDKDIVEKMRDLVISAYDRFEYITTLRDMPDEGPFCDCYDLYNAGEIISPHFWFILRCLKEVVDREQTKLEDKK